MGKANSLLLGLSLTLAALEIADGFRLELPWMRDTCGVQAADSDRRLVAFVRRVDGVSHVAIGPLVLAGSGPVSVRVGVPRVRLAGFLSAFTVYGCLVLRESRSADPRRLFLLAASGNLAFLACMAVSYARHDLTPAGRLIHAVAAASAVHVGARAVRGLLHAR